MKTHKNSSSQASWALLTQGVTSARLDAHRLSHLITRALKLVEKSSKKEHLHQIAGDLLLDIPNRLSKLEITLDKTSLALALLGESFLSPRLSLSDKQLIEDAIKPSSIRHRSSAQKIAAQWISKKSGRTQ